MSDEEEREEYFRIRQWCSKIYILSIEIEMFVIDCYLLLFVSKLKVYLLVILSIILFGFYSLCLCLSRLYKSK